MVFAGDVVSRKPPAGTHNLMPKPFQQRVLAQYPPAWTRHLQMAFNISKSVDADHAPSDYHAIGSINLSLTNIDSDSSSGSFPLPGHGGPEAPPHPPMADYVNTAAAVKSRRLAVTEAVAAARAKAAEEAAEEARRLEQLQAYMRRSDWVGVEPVTAIDMTLDDPDLVEIMRAVNEAAADFSAAAAAEAQLLEAHEGRVLDRGLLRSVRDYVAQNCPGVADDSDSSSGNFPLPDPGEPEAPPPPPMPDYVNTPAALNAQRKYVDKAARSTAQQRNYENRAASSSASSMAVQPIPFGGRLIPQVDRLAYTPPQEAAAWRHLTDGIVPATDGIAEYVAKGFADAKKKHDDALVAKGLADAKRIADAAAKKKAEDDAAEDAMHMAHLQQFFDARGFDGMESEDGVINVTAAVMRWKRAPATDDGINSVDEAIEVSTAVTDLTNTDATDGEEDLVFCCPDCGRLGHANSDADWHGEQGVLFSVLYGTCRACVIGKERLQRYGHKG